MKAPRYSLIVLSGVLISLVLTTLPAQAAVRSDRVLKVLSRTVSGGDYIVTFKNVSRKKTTASMYNYRNKTHSKGKDVGAGRSASLKMPIAAKGSTTLSLQSRRTGEHTSSIVEKVTRKRGAQTVDLYNPTRRTATGVLWIDNPNKGSWKVFICMRRAGKMVCPNENRPSGRIKAGASGVTLRTKAINPGEIVELKVYLDTGVVFRVLQDKMQMARPKR